LKKDLFCSFGFVTGLTVTDVGIVIGINVKELMEINVTCRENDKQDCQKEINK